MIAMKQGADFRIIFHWYFTSESMNFIGKGNYMKSWWQNDNLICNEEDNKRNATNDGLGMNKLEQSLKATLEYLMTI